MKLLVCPECSDVFNLQLHVKTCGCGKTRGQYVDNINAIYSGGIPLGFANSEFVDAVVHQPPSGWGKEFKAFVIPVECPTFKEVKEWSSDESTPKSTPRSSSSSRTKTSSTKSKSSAKRR